MYVSGWIRSSFLEGEFSSFRLVASSRFDEYVSFELRSSLYAYPCRDFSLRSVYYDLSEDFSLKSAIDFYGAGDYSIVSTYKKTNHSMSFSIVSLFNGKKFKDFSLKNLISIQNIGSVWISSGFIENVRRSFYTKSRYKKRSFVDFVLKSAFYETVDCNDMSYSIISSFIERNKLRFFHMDSFEDSSYQLSILTVTKYELVDSIFFLSHSSISVFGEVSGFLSHAQNVNIIGLNVLGDVIKKISTQREVRVVTYDDLIIDLAEMHAERGAMADIYSSAILLEIKRFIEESTPSDVDLYSLSLHVEQYKLKEIGNNSLISPSFDTTIRSMKDTVIVDIIVSNFSRNTDDDMTLISISTFTFMVNKKRNVSNMDGSDKYIGLVHGYVLGVPSIKKVKSTKFYDMYLYSVHGKRSRISGIMLLRSIIKEKIQENDDYNYYLHSPEEKISIISHSSFLSIYEKRIAQYKCIKCLGGTLTLSSFEYGISDSVFLDIFSNKYENCSRMDSGSAFISIENIHDLVFEIKIGRERHSIGELDGITSHINNFSCIVYRFDTSLSDSIYQISTVSLYVPESFFAASLGDVLYGFRMPVLRKLSDVSGQGYFSYVSRIDLTNYLLRDTLSVNKFYYYDSVNSQESKFKVVVWE